MEGYWANRNYENEQTLQQYAGYHEPINAIIPHGVYLNQDSEPNVHELAVPLPAVLSYPKHVDDSWQGHKIVVPSASPYLYALEMRPPLPRKTATVFMPYHCTDKVSVERDMDKTLETLSQYGNVVVCLHWQDKKRDKHLPYVEAGYPVISLGQGQSPGFMRRLVTLMCTCSLTISDKVSGPTWYSLAAGTPHVIIDTGLTTDVAPDFPQPKPSKKREQENRRIASLFYRPGITTEQRKIAAYMLGAKRLKSPSGLRADLEYVAGL